MHDCEGYVTEDPSMGLPLSDAGVDTILEVDSIEELLGYTAKRAEQ